MARKRVIYQSEALFSGPTGATTTGSIAQIHRVQDISHSVEVARTDVNEFGKLAALSREIIEVPTVSLDFSYLAIDGFNEASGIGLTVQGYHDGKGNLVSTPTNCLSDILANNTSEKNYYIMTREEGTDATQDDPYSQVDFGGMGVIGVGNGFLTSYAFNAAVGELPNVSTSVEASNLRFDTSGSGFANPAIDFELGTSVGGDGIELPLSSTGELQAFAVRPGDITVNFGTDKLSQGGALLDGMENLGDASVAAVQSVAIDLPLSRTPLQALGSVFPKSRELDLPITTTLTVSANLADISSGDLNSLICSDQASRNIKVTMRNRCGQGADLMVFEMRGATLDSQSMSASIGDNKTVDLTFSAQVGGPQDTDKGLFISGLAS